MIPRKRVNTFTVLSLFYIGLIFIRLRWGADLFFNIIYAPDDDSLYLTRAYEFLRGNGFGAYDSALLEKLPFFSFWVATLRYLGIPYLIGTHVFYWLSGWYFLLASRNYSRSLWVGGALSILIVLNPLTFSDIWYRLMREAFSISLSLFFWGAILFIWTKGEATARYILHLAILAISLACLSVTREDDTLMPYFYVLLGMALCYRLSNGRHFELANLRRAGVVLLFPLATSFLFKFSIRNFMERHYGVRSLHEMSEGEYPPLIAAIRRIKTKKDNRHVMVPQEAIHQISQLFPEFAPVAKLLPAPGPHSYSCGRFHVCSEWTNGWMVFWIKHSAFQAGMTPTAIEAERYFKSLRLKIDTACDKHQLECRPYVGQGLIPSFQLKWARDFVIEWLAAVEMVAEAPMSIQEPYPSHAFPDNRMEVGRLYSYMLQGSDFDSHEHFDAKLNQKWGIYPKELRENLEYWLENPEVATSAEYGPQTSLSGGRKHYETRGKGEKRIWGEQKTTESIPWNLVKTRSRWIGFFRAIDTFVVVFALIALLVLIASGYFTPLVLLFCCFLATVFLKTLAIAHVATYMGTLDPRLFYSTYLTLLLLSVLIIAEARQTLKDA